MISTAVIGTAALGAWLATPFVAMARRGTVDDRTRATMRTEGPRVAAVRRAQRREALVLAASIPAPRAAGHDVLPRRSELVGV